eukprot:TRINITY_DN4062_c0_g1_i1.p1 TRINITY_DN4062_c0_g1~~TRINITY_DN4062_c0_g1_i1.p1  ORF type:complete len:588 (+),score=138.55 TRINITY_DN4062_c0_g1_i1:45-1766(+)
MEEEDHSSSTFTFRQTLSQSYLSNILFSEDFGVDDSIGERGDVERIGGGRIVGGDDAASEENEVTEGLDASGSVNIEVVSGDVGVVDLEYDIVPESGTGDMDDKLKGGECEVKDNLIGDNEPVISNSGREFAVLKQNDPDRRYEVAYLNIQRTIFIEEGHIEAVDVQCKETNAIYKKIGDSFIIKAGTLEDLISLCASPTYDETGFTNIFLQCYRTFTTDIDVLNGFIMKYLEIIKNTEMNEEEKTVSKMMIMNTIKLWVDENPLDFSETQSLFYKQFYNFVSKNIAKDFKSYTDKICAVLDGSSSRPSRLFTPKRLSKSKKKKNVNSKNFLSYDLKTFGGVLNLITQEYYLNITPNECYSEIYSVRSSLESKSPNIFRMVDFFNKIGAWCCTEIATCQKLEKRWNVFKKMIKLAKFCLDHNNFETTMAIMSGLRSIPIYRMKRTWEKLENHSKVKRIYDELDDFMRNEDNHRQYRLRLLECEPPAVPFIGLFLKDFTVIGDTIPNEITHNGVDLINFEKRRKLCNIIQKVTKWHHMQYEFPDDLNIRHYIDHYKPLSEDEAYEVSLISEPRS